MNRLSKLNTVDLANPITINDKEHRKIELRKPNAGELRGLAVVDILRMDVDAMSKLLPRITLPHLSAAQVATLDPEDFTELAGKAVLFFVKKEQIEGDLIIDTAS